MLKSKNYNLLLASTILYFVTAEFLAAILKNWLTANTADTIVIIMSYLFCLGTVYALRPKFKSDWNSIKSKKSELWLISVFLLLDVFLQILLSNIFTAAASNQNNFDTAIKNHNAIMLVAVFILFVIAGPIVEEIIFQYFIQDRIVKFYLQKTKLPKWLSISLIVIIPTLLFMFYHTNNWNDIANLSIFSYGNLIVFAVLYQITDDNLIYPISVHILNNLIAFLLVL
ncbi:CPBP family intramembrane glutamic endopeptidase [Companilactobacillus insicii]|uniref:CPBP family intramembrane glutamic endopeptidase n=1 Tax=Companilactobacillus insicii TaxID=1732567 RepID=UPI001B86BC5A|nr:CPBP family intramembrane glutamic endopeptidase [Companilactobacillus insicii]